eukprot:Seg2199.4 transcript_id=Seg2199.4/GoldUCD/mRNA.D3Y31 product="Cyclin-D-binding Myb-like transcription factor 1" protein_id=Seg2199.4/GoldUCD/D3Y31
MKFEEITAEGEHKNCKVSEHRRRKSKKREAAVVKECTECLPEVRIDIDAIGPDDIQSWPTSQIHKKQRKSKKHKRKKLENHNSQVENVSKLCTRIEECGKPARLSGDQDNTIRYQPEKCTKKRRKETHTLGGKIFRQHGDLLKTNVKECDDYNINFSDANPNFIGNSIKIEENKCHERLIANQNGAIMNHKQKKKKKKKLRDLEDRIIQQGQIHINRSEPQKRMSDNSKDVANVDEMKQDQLVESEFTENDGEHKHKKKRKNIDLFPSPAGEILETENVETLNQKMQVEKPRRREIKEKTDIGLSCKELVIGQKGHTVRLLKKDCNQTIEVNKQDTSTNFVRKRKKKKSKHQSNDLQERHAVDAACVSLNTGKLCEKQVIERENGSSHCSKRIKIECINDLECDEKKTLGSDEVEARILKSTNVQGKFEGVDCSKIDIKGGTDKVNEKRTSVPRTCLDAENDLGNDNDQADFIFPNIYGSDGDSSGSSESEEDDLAIEHLTLFELMADNNDQSDSWKARDATDSKDDNAVENASPEDLSKQPKINKQALKNKLQGLDHDLRFKWHLRPADIDKLKHEGIQFETGKWTKDEVEILESNMIEFCDTAGMSLQEFKNLLMDKSATGRKIKKELGVYTILTVGLNRKIDNVYRKTVTCIDPCNHKGEWSIQEENNLLELYRKYGCRWSKIGSELGRSLDSVCEKIRRLLIGDLHKGFDNVTPSIQGPWTTDEEDRLLKLVKEFSTKIECNDDKESGKRKPICWVTVAAHFKTRTYDQCRMKWLNDLSWKKPGQKVRRWPNEDLAKFLTLLNDCGEKYDKHEKLGRI